MKYMITILIAMFLVGCASEQQYRCEVSINAGVGVGDKPKDEGIVEEYCSNVR